jgi:hypothetical protein
MERIEAFFRSLYWTVLSVTVLPALAYAQGATSGRAPSTGGGAAPAGGAGIPAGDTSGATGGAGWLWIVAALVVLAIVWWAMGARRRHGTATR